MAEYEIRRMGERCLREKSSPVSENRKGLCPMLDEMAAAMKKSGGVGLAAPQVGVNERIIILDAGDGLVEIINPEISASEGSGCMAEGCLSVPGAEVEVRRAEKILLKGLDRNFKPVEYRLEGLSARIAQHEIDHLDGILIVDHMSIIKRKLFEKKWKKSSK